MTHLPEKQKRRNKRWVCINVPSVEELAGIPDDEIMKSTLPKGYYLWILAPDMRTIYAVLSEHVRLTRGVLDYLYDYVRWGPNKIHNKLFLCPSYNQRKCCDNGFLCREVHSDFSTDTAVEATAYNVFSNANGCLTSAERKENKGLPPPPNVMLWHSLHSRWTPASAYPTLPSGIPFRVAIPNSPKPFEEFDSGRLFATKVAREHYNRLSRNEPPTVTLQHCANFSKNGVCCFGQNCQFVHVVHYSGERSGDDDSLDDVSPGSMQCNSNGNSKNNNSNNNNNNDNDNNDNNSQGAILPPKLNTTSFSESFGDASRTSFPLMHFSLPPSPCASLNGPQRFQNTQSGSSENGLTNTQTLALSPSALQAGLLPQHRDQFQQRQQQFQVPPPAQQKHQQQHHHHHHQQQQQRQILQSSLSTGNLTRLNPPNQPLFFLQGSPQPQMPMHPMYTVMLSPPDCHMNGVSPLYVVPY